MSAADPLARGRATRIPPSHLEESEVLSGLPLSANVVEQTKLDLVIQHGGHHDVMAFPVAAALSRAAPKWREEDGLADAWN